MSTERFFDDLARTLAEPMPRRRAVRVLGVSLAALAVPAVSPKIARAGLSRPGRHGGLDQATCPDGSTCTTAGDVCCSTKKSPLSGNYVCRRPNQVCCCGNTACTPPKQRCFCPGTPGSGGTCAPNCPLVYGRNFKNCGTVCCQPHERCADETKSKCVSCEQDGKQTCRSYDDKKVICCPASRGSTSSCCANTRSATCCGPKQRCKAQDVRTAKCVCKKGEGDKCGLDCCKKNETCCNRSKCCAQDETCTSQGCCPADRAVCKTGDSGKTVCCGDGEFCLWKTVTTTGPGEDDLVPLGGVCKRGCAPGNRAGKQCCGTGYKPNKKKTACVRA